MATIYTSVDVDVDIEIDEFVDSCSSRDIENLLRYLSNQGYMSKFGIPDETKMTAQEERFAEQLASLSRRYHQMSSYEIEFIENLYNKYR
jgi:CRP-like cAMP-binding protein